MYRISKKFSFSASHILEHLPEEHQCARLHGHNYCVTVHLKAKILNKYGFVKDYKTLDVIKQFIDHSLDHQHLNDCMDCQPTCENIARFLFEKFKPEIPELCAIELSETPQTSCIYEP